MEEWRCIKYILHIKHLRNIEDTPISGISIAVSDVQLKDDISAKAITYLEEAHKAKELMK